MTTRLSVAELCRQGALADVCRLIHAGYTQRPALNRLRLDYPAQSQADLQAVYQLAAEACAAAGQVQATPYSTRHDASIGPRLPED